MGFVDGSMICFFLSFSIGGGVTGLVWCSVGVGGGAVLSRYSILRIYWLAGLSGVA